MSNPARAWRSRATRLATLGVMGMTVIALTGCEQEASIAGQDASYLTGALDAEIPASERVNLFPLAKGNTWEMNAVCAGKTSRDRHVVRGAVSEADVSGVQVDHLRDGAPWRREIFRSKNGELSLVGMQDETSQLMRFHPAVPLLKEPVKEGASWMWYGEFRMGKEVLPARAYSRVSGQESVATPAGKFKSYRVDSIVVVTRRGQEVRFPTVRWFAPRIGYVRRGFADKGRPAFSEVTKFNVQ